MEHHTNKTILVGKSHQAPKQKGILSIDLLLTFLRAVAK